MLRLLSILLTTASLLFANLLLAQTISNTTTFRAGMYVTSTYSDFSGVFNMLEAADTPSLAEADLIHARLYTGFDEVDNAFDACEPLVHVPAGSIILAEEAVCSYHQQFLNAQEAGAKALILYWYNDPLPMEVGSGITIPGVMINYEDAQFIVNTLVAGNNSIVGALKGMWPESLASSFYRSIIQLLGDSGLAQ